MSANINLLSSVFFTRLINIGLRGSTLLAKFALLFLLAYYLSPENVAIYGLLVATVSYSIYALGFDFYIYTTRELLGSSSELWLKLLRDQGVLILLAYVLCLPLLTTLFIFDLLPWSIAPWFFVLLIFEHLAQELNRILVAMSRQLCASIVQFLRSGVWVLAVAIIYWLFPELRRIEVVLTVWVIGVILACSVGFLVIAKLDRDCLNSAINWRWLARGVKIALPLLVATLAIRALFTVDRYWVEVAAGTEVLAAYVLFAGVANAVTSFLDAGVFVFLYPKVVKAFQYNDWGMFNSGMKSLCRQTLILSPLICVAAGVLTQPILLLIDKEVYFSNVVVLYILLLAIFLFSISMIPHYGLYAMNQDKAIIKSNVIALLVFLGLGVATTGALPVLSVPLSLCGAFFVMLLQKTIIYKISKRKLMIGELCK